MACCSARFQPSQSEAPWGPSSAPGGVWGSSSTHLPSDTRTCARSVVGLCPSATAAWLRELSSTLKSSILRLARSFTSHRTRKREYWGEVQQLRPSLLL